jgi:hypothetical protein
MLSTENALFGKTVRTTMISATRVDSKNMMKWSWAMKAIRS